MITIIEGYITMSWDINVIQVVERMDRGRIKDDLLTSIDKHFIEVEGEDPGEAGYVLIEHDNDVMWMACDTTEEMDYIYNQIVDSIVYHPQVIDLRKIDRIRFGTK